MRPSDLCAPGISLTATVSHGKSGIWERQWGGREENKRCTVRRDGKGVEQWQEGEGRGESGRERRRRERVGEMVGERRMGGREIQDKGETAAAGEKSHRGRKRRRGRGTNTHKEMLDRLKQSKMSEERLRREIERWWTHRA